MCVCVRVCMSLRKTFMPRKDYSDTIFIIKINVQFINFSLNI